MSIIKFSIILLLGLADVLNCQQCSNIGEIQVFYDPSCAQGGAGCNAGGQGQLCRFCGFDIFPPCPSSTSSTSTTTKTTGTTGTTGTTTPRTTTERTTRITSSNPNPGCFVIEEEEDWDENGEKLVFHDDFEFLDFKKWKHDITLSGGGNWEFQLYHNNRTNSFIKDGVLHIRPTLTEDRIGQANLRSGYRMDLWGGSPADQCTGNNFYGCERTSGAGGNILNPIQSAKLTTATTFSIKYGRVEVRAKLPKGDWLWPAIWMLPANNVYGMWPASGEIDIMESRGNANYPSSAEGGVESFGSTLHWGADWTQNRFELTHNIYTHPTPLSDEFHTYGLYWTEERLFTYIDDPSNVVLDVDMTSRSFWELGKFHEVYENPWEGAGINAPFNNEFYLILNLAVGGTAGYFKDGVAGKPWSDKSPNSVNEFYAAKNQWYPTWNNKDLDFEIDSVKIWKLRDYSKKV